MNSILFVGKVGRCNVAFYLLGNFQLVSLTVDVMQPLCFISRVHQLESLNSLGNHRFNLLVHDLELFVLLQHQLLLNPKLVSQRLGLLLSYVSIIHGNNEVSPQLCGLCLQSLYFGPYHHGLILLAKVLSRYMDRLSQHLKAIKGEEL